MLLTRRSLLFLSIAGLIILLYIVPLGFRPILIPDEPRYGEIPREMISGGDWIVPHFNGLRYFEKPILGYWAHALSLLIFGENAFALRFPSALATGFMVVLMIFLLTEYFRNGFINNVGQTCGTSKYHQCPDYYDPGVILVSSFIFLTCLEVYAVGTFSLLDALFSCLVTGSIACFYCAWADKDRKGVRIQGFLVGAGVFCGLAFLTKGFLAFVLPVITLVPFLVWQRDWKAIFSLSWSPILMAIVVALPWSLAIHLREPDFWKYFIFHEHLNRYLGGEQAQHKESFWLFIAWLPAAVFPWFFLLPAAVRGLIKSEKQNPFVCFLLCWFIFPFLFFSFSSGKLLTYILPCFIPFAILMALGLREYRRYGCILWENVGLFLLAFLAALLIFFLVITQTGILGSLNYAYANVTTWIALGGGLTALCALTLINLNLTSFPGKYINLALAPVLFYFLLPLNLPDKTLSKKAPEPFLQKIKQTVAVLESDILVADESCAGAVCWFLKRDDISLLDKPGEFAYGLNFPDAEARHLSFDAFNKLIQSPKRTSRIILIFRGKRYHNWLDQITVPPDETYWNEGSELVALVFN